jgi:hypothetical protein
MRRREFITLLSVAFPPPRGSAADPRYLESLAQRLAADAVLPLDQARRQVQALAISATPRGEPQGSPKPWVVAWRR